VKEKVYLETGNLKAKNGGVTRIRRRRKKEDLQKSKGGVHLLKGKATAKKKKTLQGKFNKKLRKIYREGDGKSEGGSGALRDWKQTVGGLNKRTQKVSTGDRRKRIQKARENSITIIARYRRSQALGRTNR